MGLCPFEEQPHPESRRVVTRLPPSADPVLDAGIQHHRQQRHPAADHLNPGEHQRGEAHVRAAVRPAAGAEGAGKYTARLARESSWGAVRQGPGVAAPVGASCSWSPSPDPKSSRSASTTFHIMEEGHREVKSLARCHTLFSSWPGRYAVSAPEPCMAVIVSTLFPHAISVHRGLTSKCQHLRLLARRLSMSTSVHSSTEVWGIHGPRSPGAALIQ